MSPTYSSVSLSFWCQLVFSLLIPPSFFQGGFHASHSLSNSTFVLFFLHLSLPFTSLCFLCALFHPYYLLFKKIHFTSSLLFMYHILLYVIFSHVFSITLIRSCINHFYYQSYLFLLFVIHVAYLLVLQFFVIMCYFRLLFFIFLSLLPFWTATSLHAIFK